MLPNFIIVGAARSGTTSLNSYLDAHPDVFMCQIKEPHFFAFINSAHQFKGPYDKVQNDRIVRDISAYESLFSKHKGERAIGETSPGYLFLLKAAENIKKYIPECKIIILLRDPVKRTFSHYKQHVMMGHEKLGFEKALKEEEKRRSLNWRWFFEYKNQSLYYKQVSQYYALFDRSQIKVVLFEDLIKNPLSITSEIADFIGVDPGFYSNFKFEAKYQTGTPKLKIVDDIMRGSGLFKKVTRRILPNKYKRSIYKFLKKNNYDYNKKTEMPKAVKSHLEKEFTPDVLLLQDLIDKDLSQWSLQI